MRGALRSLRVVMPHGPMPSATTIDRADRFAVESKRMPRFSVQMPGADLEDVFHEYGRIRRVAGVS